MKPVQFTQYLRPYGHKKSVSIERPDEIAHKAEELLSAGCWFDIEVLTTGQVSMTCGHEHPELVVFTLSHKICSNDPAVLENVDALINEAYEYWQNHKDADGKLVLPPYGL